MPPGKSLKILFLRENITLPSFLLCTNTAFRPNRLLLRLLICFHLPSDSPLLLQSPTNRALIKRSLGRSYSYIKSGAQGHDQAKQVYSLYSPSEAEANTLINHSGLNWWQGSPAPSFVLFIKAKQNRTTQSALLLSGAWEPIRVTIGGYHLSSVHSGH